MKTRKKTCKECPFIKGCAPGWLGPHSIDDIMLHFRYGLSFTCHMERTGETKPEDIEAGSISICRGFLASANKSAKMFREPKLKQLQDQVKTEQRENLDNVLAQWEFFNYHNLKEQH